MSEYVGRLAPSPTGLLHLGHARTFAVAARRAREAGGRLWMRLDDLDRDRAKAEFAEAALEDLRWLGLGWDGPVVRQSERISLYRAALERLMAQGVVFSCMCSRRDLREAIGAPQEGEDEPVYPGTCRGRVARSFQAGVNYRMRVPEGERVVFIDGGRGPQSFVAGVDVGDFLLWRKDDLPSYQLATVVDEAEMGVTEVVRGEDLLKSAARQSLVARSLGVGGWGWFHVPLLRDAEGKRLAKRHDSLGIRVLRERGMTPAEVLAASMEG